jgi:hypothetical protein
MKNSIKLTALFLLAGVGLFAATSATASAPVAPSTTDVITFSSLSSQKGVDIKVERAMAGKAIVMIYDQDRNVIYKDVLPAYKTLEKGYILSQLDNGDYTIEVTSNKQVVKKEIHVYDEDSTRQFIIKE